MGWQRVYWEVGLVETESEYIDRSTLDSIETSLSPAFISPCAL